MRRALRRHLLVLLLMVPICAVAVVTTLLDPWAAALIFTGMAIALGAGGEAMRAFTDGDAADSSKERQTT
ncbi:MAG: hypothetical protein HOU81_27070 [Hamadaea sp.]|uniref:hypothetical protein n=1 Tax=Hamadaea sp. TaxID=2024425 RepID=UPI0017AE07CD|nr:hypothetical protein [Hamadaea sp.]NUR74487.1 hypothetical protein [Hamadaea sp.]NUT21416.1 hypothetical protein [Hamadaea sp.]